MPRLTRWYLKSGLLYVIIALLVGVLLAPRAVVPLPPGLTALGPVYFHLLMVGWVSQMIFGVVFWIFPKQSAAQPRGSERWGRSDGT